MANTIDIVVPDLGDFDNVEVIEVLVASGDTVAREDGLVTIETDKASMDIPSPEDGVIEKLTIGVGDTVSTGDVIGQLTTEGDDTEAQTPATESASSEDAPGGKEDSADEESATQSAGKQTLVVPELGDFTDVEVIEVHIAVGDRVEVEDSLVTLETDKAAMDVPSEFAGTIESVLVKVGDKVSHGSSVAVIEAEVSAASAPAKEPAKAAAKAPAEAPAKAPPAAPVRAPVRLLGRKVHSSHPSALVLDSSLKPLPVRTRAAPELFEMPRYPGWHSATAPWHSPL